MIEPRAAAGLRWRCPCCAKRLGEVDGGLRCRRCEHDFDHRAGVWRFAPGFEPDGFRPARAAHLATIESSHFWFSPRTTLLEGLLERVEGTRRDRAIELGCGGGRFLASLADRYRTVVGVDAYEEALTRARERTPSAALMSADVLRVPLDSEQFDLVVALDVLEHVDSRPFLDEARRLGRDDAWLLLSVPAFPCLWSRLDIDAGHRCRYRRDRLAGELQDSGWHLEHVTHYQMLLFPLVFLTRRWPGRRLHRVERRPPRFAGRMLGAVNRFEVRRFAARSLPFGSSLCVLARRRP